MRLKVAIKRTYLPRPIPQSDIFCLSFLTHFPIKANARPLRKFFAALLYLISVLHLTLNLCAVIQIRLNLVYVKVLT